MRTTVRRRDRSTDEAPTLTGVYGRQSNAKLKSIADQIAEGLADCEHENLPEPIVYSDDVSASRWGGGKARGGWTQILDDIAAFRLNVLWLWESSRGDRDAEAWLGFLRLCREHGVRLRIGNHHRTYDPQVRRDWKTLAEDGIDNEDEVWKLSERVERGLSSSAEAGKPHGKTPFGYVRTYDPRTRALIEQAPDELPRVTATGHVWTPAGVVREIFRDLLRGSTLVAIADRLNVLGIPCPRLLAALESDTPLGPGRWDGTEPGKDGRARRASIWGSKAVRDIALNAAYIGIRVYGGKIVATECWTELVTKEQYWAACNLLRDPRRRVNGTPDTVALYLLSGIGRCAVCGDTLSTIERKPGRRTYNCRGARGCVSVSMAMLDDHVEECVLGWLALDENLARLSAIDDASNNSARVARADAERYRADLDEWQAQLDDPDYKPVDHDRHARALQKAMDDANERARTAGLSAALRPFVGSTPARATQIWVGLSLAVKRNIIRDLISVTVLPAGRGRGGRRPPMPIRERVIVEVLVP